ncbi:ATP-dependent DNA helicase [Isoptericola aurantiacus]|uniref:ATP-dependent DNA helicase n=1 Tax=Isoptericola aurantiacus TaxID=3377839 RepID=UPI00383B9E5A
MNSPDPADSPAEPAPTSQDDVATLLGLAVGALGGTPRAGQQQMAAEVAAAVDSGRHLLVQAGTGTGKSLGYLVPAVHHAVTAGERVVVSTATLALQRQVITRDLPLVADAVAPRLPRPAKVALLKGWHNYLCRHKVAGGYPTEGSTLFDLPADPGPGEGAAAEQHPASSGGRVDDGARLADHVRRLHAWAEESDTGDRDDLVPGVPDRAWRQVSVTSLECLGQRCPLIEECFGERARLAAREADVVVTNHAMLGIAASGNPNVLPEHGVLVVDEAHELADRITAAATVDLAAGTVEHAARLARRHGGVRTDDLDATATTLARMLLEVPAERYPQGLPDELRAVVASVRDAARGLLTELRPDKNAEADSGVKMAQSAVQQLFDVTERMAAEDTSGDVLWCSRPPADAPWGDGVARLHAAPLAVAGLIGSQLLGERTAVLTSATLELGGTFDPVARSLGLEVSTGGDDASWRGVDVGSPFDYATQGICYVARHLPAPGREPTTEAQLDEIADLVEAAGGRTLGLFSSRRAATAAAEAMRERLDVPVLCQGDDQLPTLVRRFSEDPATCLFGTLSLWQGVDVPGDACRLVIIDRIPFPRPDDPVKAARARAVEEAGGNGFMQVAATHAALLLAQGSGRLIRSVTDRGVVAVLDPRLATARYGTFLARSLPPFWKTTDPQLVRAALRRLDA